MDRATSGMTALTNDERVALFTAAKAEWLPPMGRDPLEVAVERILTARHAALLVEHEAEVEALRSQRDNWAEQAREAWRWRDVNAARAEAAEAQVARLQALVTYYENKYDEAHEEAPE